MDIPRPQYLQSIEPFIGKGLIKAFVGQRQVGKSSLMRLVRDQITATDPHAHVIYIDLENYEHESLRTDRDLMDYVNSHRQDGGSNVLFVDEIQEIEGFERALRSLNASGDFDIYITGSNANLLSRELSTLLAGRCIEIEVYPLSFKEFLEFHQREASTASLQAYMKYGGLPYLRHLELQDDIVFDYLKNIVRSILYRDVVNRHQVRNTDLLEKVMYFLADQTGSLISAKKISDTLQAHQVKTSPKTILNMISHFTDACILNRVKRFAIKGRKVFETHEKFYFTDLGLRNAITGVRVNDINQWMENVVYLHLLMRGYKVHVGQDQAREIDFVAEKQGKLEYIQVAYLLPNEKVVEREFGNLLKIQDQYPKKVISMDPMVLGDHKGVEHQQLMDFLLL